MKSTYFLLLWLVGTAHLSPCDEFTYSPSSRAILLPGYPEPQLTDGVIATIEIEAVFEQGRPTETRLKSALFQAPNEPDYADKYGPVVKAWIERVIHVVKQWRSNTTSQFAATVSIEYALDKSVGAGERRYEVRYGSNGIPARVAIIGPVGRQ